MYFSDITNNELQQFHGKITAPNFNIELSKILHKTSNVFDNHLFKVEEIIINKLYRIYPLFYCKTITSSNHNDKIIENKCIIAQKNSNETYYTFISEDNEIIFYDDIKSFFDIGHKLSEAEFNSIVQLFRSLQLSEDIQIRNNVVNGKYGDYTFDLEEATIIDNGVLITQETLTHVGTVRLVNPVFSASTYVLHLKIYSMDDINIGLASRNNIEITDLDITLVENTDVNIPFETLKLNNIIGFDATVTITHDKPIIVFTKQLSFTMSGTTKVDETLTFRVNYNKSGTALEGKTITLYDGETSLATGVTDNDGVTIITYSPNAAKEYKFHVECTADEVTSKIKPVLINQEESNITLETNLSTVYVKRSGNLTSNFTVSGKLTKEGINFSGVNVKLYNKGTLIETLTTQSDGTFRTTLYPNGTSQTYELQAIYEGTSAIAEAKSSFVSVIARKIRTTLTFNANKTNIAPGDTVTFSGKLTDEFGNGIENAIIGHYTGSSYTTSDATTNQNGEFSFTKTISDTGSVAHYVIWRGYTTGDFMGYTHETCDSNKKTISCSKIATSINISASSLLVASDDVVTVTASVSSDDSGFNPSSVVFTVDGVDTTVSTKNNNGDFELELTPFNANIGYHVVTARFPETTRYLGSTSNSLTVNYKFETYIVASTQTLYNMCFYKASLYKSYNNTRIANKTLKLRTGNGNSGQNTSSATEDIALAWENESCSNYTWTFEGDAEYFGTTKTSGG